MADSSPVIAVNHLSIALPARAERQYAVRDLCLTLNENEMLCVVGESGAGKSLIGQAIMGLLPEPAVKAVGGQIIFEGQDLLKMPELSLRQIRGAKISMIFQEPMTALNPLLRVGRQVEEILKAHGVNSKTARQQRVLELFESVGLPQPSTLVEAYPFRLSGGQRQRVMIAMALAFEPQVLIADEPTTALDVTTQAQILQLIKNVQAERKMCVLFVTHDFGVVADIADRVIVLRRGEVVESGSARQVLNSPEHDYTKKLIASVPNLTVDRRSARPIGRNLLVASGICKTFYQSGGLFGKERVIPAVTPTDVRISQGETLGLVGESGSGKSTLGRLIVRLIEPDDGTLTIDGTDFRALRGEALRRRRKAVQMVFQDPFGSLNPRRKIGSAISEVMQAHGTSTEDAALKTKELLSLVGLDPLAVHRFPHEFSGGQRQRIAIARALALDPILLIADEAVSALDVSIQKQILDLLREIQLKLGFGMLFITHDLRVAAQICDRICVMQRGRIVESGSVADVYAAPRHPYTRELLNSIPGKEWKRHGLTNQQSRRMAD